MKVPAAEYEGLGKGSWMVDQTKEPSDSDPDLLMPPTSSTKNSKNLNSQPKLGNP